MLARRLDEDVFEKIGRLATAEHRSMTNYIEYVLLKHLAEVEGPTPGEETTH